MRSKRGKIVFNGVVLQPHEQAIAELFIEQGINIELIPTARQQHRKTADAIINGLEWEFKTLRGETTKSIERLLKKACKQSCNIIVDIRHTHIQERRAIAKIRYEFKNRSAIKRIKVISKSGRIIDL